MSEYQEQIKTKASIKEIIRRIISTYIDNPTGAVKGKKKVVRGNCWVNGFTTSDLERRVAREPQVSNHHLGVRLVRTYL